MKNNQKHFLLFKPFLFSLGISIIIISLYIRAPVSVADSSIAPAGTYTWFNLNGNNLTNVNDDVTVNNVPNLGNSPYFWSHEIYFTGSNLPSGATAYIGIQGINKAVFSVFDWPSPEASPICNVEQSGFDGGAYSYGGTSCIISYNLTQGHTYQLQITDIGQDSNGINWQGVVTDLTTGQTTDIATVNVPSSWGTISDNSVVWTEDFGGTISSCTSQPYSDVTFDNLTGNNSQYTVSSHSDTISQNDCTDYSRVTDNSNSSFTQEMGLSSPVTETIVPYSPPASSTPAPTSTTPKTTTSNSPTSSTPATTTPATPTIPPASVNTPTLDSTATLSITVTNSSGIKLAGAKVVLDNKQVSYTDKDGMASFSAVPSGTHSIVVTQSSSKPASEKVTTTPGENKQLTLKLTSYKTGLQASLGIEVAVAVIVVVLLAIFYYLKVLRPKQIGSKGPSLSTAPITSLNTDNDIKPVTMSTTSNSLDFPINQQNPIMVSPTVPPAIIPPAPNDSEETNILPKFPTKPVSSG